MKISVIIPMYNESKIIENTARVLHDYMKRIFDDYEIIFFDDGSTDSSSDIVKSLKLDGVRVLGGSKNRGKGAAVREAMLEADGDIRMFTDADLAYGTDVIGRAYRTMCDKPSLDMLLGSRNMAKDGYEGYTYPRRVMSKLYIKVLCSVGGFRLSDSQCGFKAFSSETARDIFSECTVDGFAFDFEVILRATEQGKKIDEMPVKVLNHRTSSVKPVGDAVRMLKDLKKIKKDVRGGNTRK